ncbi:hypothetical protein GQ54DRAFT_87235 [Martensiomyces pterosporus]|nr:hypothetical protein GQ54DRAFT_92033 [Martensiomyces pterosporus]KAI8318396.1 hypothetical protein GQ54DRAFT_87235 [Martensiomyces pterosporus]
MALLDELPLNILLTVVKWLRRRHWHELDFYRLLPVASVSTSLRRSLLPLLYRDLVFEFRRIRNCSTRHNAALANSAGCSECVQRVSLVVNEHTNPDDIVKAVRDGMDAGNETKWPNVCSYSYNYRHEQHMVGDSFPCIDIIRQLDKLPKLRQASPVTCSVSSVIAPLAYTPPSVSFFTQLTSLCLGCAYQGIDANRLPQLFAPTLVDLTLDGANPENVWSILYDSHENQTVVFARLKRLTIRFVNPLRWGQIGMLPPHLQGATNSALAKRSVWAAGTAGGWPDCRVPLFPALRALRCINMAYDFRDFISRTQCHDSLVSLYVQSDHVYFDFDAELFKNLETVEFVTYFHDTGEERTGSVDLYKSAFTNLLRAKTSIQAMLFRSLVCGTLFQVPPDIGCTDLRSLCLGVEVDFKSMLRLLSNLRYLVELELSGHRGPTCEFDGRQVDRAEDVDELQLPHADCPSVSSTLRRFACCLHSPRMRCYYTAAYAFGLALHLPALKDMILGVFREADVASHEAMLGRFLQKLSGSPHMNDGLLHAKVVTHPSTKWYKCCFWSKVF